MGPIKPGLSSIQALMNTNFGFIMFLINGKCRISCMDIAEVSVSGVFHIFQISFGNIWFGSQAESADCSSQKYKTYKFVQELLQTAYYFRRMSRLSAAPSQLFIMIQEAAMEYKDVLYGHHTHQSVFVSASPIITNIKEI